jgi:sarcosine oxidase delta subunit
VVFDRDNPKTYMQVIYRGTYWCRSWALLQRHEVANEKLVHACRHLEKVAMMVFAHYGWRFSNRITL